MIDSQDKRLIHRCHTLLMYNLGGLTEVSKSRDILNTIHGYGAVSQKQRQFLTEWYAQNQDQLDYMRFR